MVTPKGTMLMKLKADLARAGAFLLLSRVQVGDLVVAAFDLAARYSTDQKEVSRLATAAVILLLRRAVRASIPPQRATDWTP